jgi:DNA-binding XRE family transcriptional regulator
MKHRFIELRAQRKSLRAAADELGVGRQTLVRWEKKHREQIENLKAIELDALLERHRLTLQAQIERYGVELARLHQEIQRRDLADVPTLKLYDLSLKLLARLDALHQMFTSRDDDQIADQRALRAELEQLKSEIESANERVRARQANSVRSSVVPSIAPILKDVLGPYPELRVEIAKRVSELDDFGGEDGDNGNGEYDKHQ